MITFTQDATNQIQTLRQQMGEEANDKFLRIFVQKGGCSGFEYGMGFDEKREDDHKIAIGGEEHLIIDGHSLQFMSGAIIDFNDGLDGKGFEIKNPNAQKTCGCGKSFSTE